MNFPDQDTITALNIAPQSKQLIELDLPRQSLKAGNEYHVNFSFYDTEQRNYSDGSIEIASEQLALDILPEPFIEKEVQTTSPLRVERKNGLTVIGKSFHIQFDRLTGAISQFSYKGNNLLESPLLPCFWRVPTDNDEGRNNSYASSWRKVGLDDYKIKTKQLDFVILPTGDVQVYVNSLLEFKEGNILQKANYTISHEGEVLIDAIFYINIDVLSLARVGMKCRCSPGLWRYERQLGKALLEVTSMQTGLEPSFPVCYCRTDGLSDYNAMQIYKSIISRTPNCGKM